MVCVKIFANGCPSLFLQVKRESSSQYTVLCHGGLTKVEYFEVDV